MQLFSLAKRTNDSGPEWKDMDEKKFNHIPSPATVKEELTQVESYAKPLVGMKRRRMDDPYEN